MPRPHPNGFLALCLPLDVLYEVVDGTADGEHIALRLDHTQLHKRPDHTVAILPAEGARAWK